MLYGYTGNIGSGKTFSMCHDVITRYYRMLEQGVKLKIYANYHLKHVPYTYITLEDMLNWAQDDHVFEECLITIQEIHIWLDSRKSMSKVSRVSSYFLLQSRKKNCEIYWDTQFPDQVDKRLKNLSDTEVRCFRTKHPAWFKNKISKRSDDGFVEATRYLCGTKPIMGRFPGFSYYDTSEVAKLPKFGKKGKEIFSELG